MKSSYRELFIWQASVEVALAVITTTNAFPQQQRYILIDQMQRCAVSVPSNIAEGKGRLSRKELRQCLGIARGSLFELATQLEIATRLGFVTAEQFDDLSDRIAKIGAGINNFLHRLPQHPSRSPQHPNTSTPQ